ncbi:hypothetical protein GALMADRAFT_144252 [Galerina marginata CBS 339.88]|uniref:Uncharacterized protein n=1 Tax=Galerina marginata (strain CBS 339.88) TaxID=685588 RepID=A0A067SJV4_GALM3|nr:hypothetical protein GALMADRAFT_144252 [Galerina marginata CBS 339.88]
MESREMRGEASAGGDPEAPRSPHCRTRQSPAPPATTPSAPAPPAPAPPRPRTDYPQSPHLSPPLSLA